MNDYKITSLTSSISFKVSYKNGKLKRIEHLGTKINRETFQRALDFIPIDENVMPICAKNYESIDIVPLKAKQKSLYAEMLDTYFEFYQAKFELKPRITAIEGAALKKIIAFFLKQDESNEAIIANWHYILVHWDKLPEFYQKQADLKQINSNLNAILRLLKNERNNEKRTDDLRDAL